MNQSLEKKIIVSAAPISGPERQASYQAGRQAGEQDRQAGLVATGDEIPTAKVRRLSEQYCADQEVVGKLVLRDKGGCIPDAQAAHEAAGHLLDQASAQVNETGLTVLASTQERDATANQIIGMVNPELAQPRRDRTAETTPAPDGAEERPPRAFRYILDRKMPKGWGYGVLIALAAAEGFLNIQAFAATGESSNGSLVLAILVGIGVVGLAHRIGDCAADLLENRPSARGRSPARMTEVALGAPALIIGILGTAAIRARYYAVQNQVRPGAHIDIPTMGLVALAFMLAATAIAVSMAMRNPFADGLARQDEVIADHRHHHQQARDELLDAQNEVSVTANALRSRLQELVDEYELQHAHVRQCTEAYLDGYCTGAEVRVTDPLPEADLPQLVIDARAWLAAHPIGTYAPPTLPFSSARQVSPGRTDPGGQQAASPSTGHSTQDAKARLSEATSIRAGEPAHSAPPDPDPSYVRNGSAQPEG